MSERYQICPPCHGRGKTLTEAGRELWKKLRAEGRVTVKAEELDWAECGRCSGTGQDGSADAYLDREDRYEREEEASRSSGLYRR